MTVWSKDFNPNNDEHVIEAIQNAETMQALIQIYNSTDCFERQEHIKALIAEHS